MAASPSASRPVDSQTIFKLASRKVSAMTKEFWHDAIWSVAIMVGAYGLYLLICTIVLTLMGVL